MEGALSQGGGLAPSSKALRGLSLSGVAGFRCSPPPQVRTAFGGVAKLPAFPALKQLEYFLISWHEQINQGLLFCTSDSVFILLFPRPLFSGGRSSHPPPLPSG